MLQHLGCSCSKLGLFKLSRAKEKVEQKSGVLLWRVERTRTRHRQLQHAALPEIQLIHQNAAKLGSVASDASRTFRRPGQLFISAEEKGATDVDVDQGPCGTAGRAGVATW